MQVLIKCKSTFIDFAHSFFYHLNFHIRYKYALLFYDRNHKYIKVMKLLNIIRTIMLYFIIIWGNQLNSYSEEAVKLSWSFQVLSKCLVLRNLLLEGL